MKIAVCIKQVPNISRDCMDRKTGLMVRDKANVIENPYDLSALEFALQLKDKYTAQIDVFSMGPLSAEAVLRRAYSMGADEGYLISDKYFSGADVLATSYSLYQAIKSTANYDFIICGERTLDGDTSQVGASIATWFDIPFCYKVIEFMNYQDEQILLKYRLKDKIISTKLKMPCLLTINKESFIPRVSSLKLKLASKRKKITVLTLSDLEDDNEQHYGIKASPTKVKKIYPVAVTTRQMTKIFKQTININDIVSIIKNSIK